MPKVTKQAATGEKGVALIALRVGEMGHLWHPTSGIDSGIDGEIELRDPGSGQVRNFRIGVQSKATEGAWRTENDKTFLWRADPEHIEYWIGSNQPVILVCSRPRLARPTGATCRSGQATLLGEPVGWLISTKRATA